MNPGLVVKLRPAGPWRSGPDSGLRNRVDPIYHSDSLYSAVTSTMRLTGLLEEWLEATARNPEGSAVRFSSCFPFHEDIGYITPPRTAWPPMGGMPVVPPKVRWKSTRFVPLSVVGQLLSGLTLDEDRWCVDGPSECLVPAGSPGPFRTSIRSNAAVDRFTGNTDRHATACIEFYPGAGLWVVVSFADDEACARWSGPVRTAFRLLADTGFGGERSRGWGHAGEPEFIEGLLPGMILPEPEPPAPPAEGEEAVPPAPKTEPGYWLLSLYAPAAEDAIDWKRGDYTVVARAGRVDSPARSGDLKRHLNMITEGSVLHAGAPIRGAALDVAPENFPHPVYRAGFALAIPIQFEPRPAAAPAPVTP